MGVNCSSEKKKELWWQFCSYCTLVPIAINVDPCPNTRWSNCCHPLRIIPDASNWLLYLIISTYVHYWNSVIYYNYIQIYAHLKYKKQIKGLNPNQILLVYNKPCQSRPSNCSGPFLGFLEPTPKKLDRLALTGRPFASRHATHISPSLVMAYIGVPCGWTPASKLPVNSFNESPGDNMALIIRRCSLDTHWPASGDQTCSLRWEFRCVQRPLFRWNGRLQLRYSTHWRLVWSCDLESRILEEYDTGF